VPLDALAAPRKGRPTVYAGIEFRSRLEARWACLFDRLGVRWVYEPLDGNRYTPDFLLHEFVEVDQPALAEVKPAITRADYRAPIAKVTAGLAGHWKGAVLILGADPLPPWPGWRPPSGDDPAGRYEPMGLIGYPHHDDRWEVYHWFGGNEYIGGIRAAWAAACNTTKWRPS
jgi:hypothetical protein